MTKKHAFSCLAVAVLLSACGNKGPLVMPQKPVPVQQPVPALPPAPADPADAPLPAPPADDGTDG